MARPTQRQISRSSAARFKASQQTQPPKTFTPPYLSGNVGVGQVLTINRGIYSGAPSPIRIVLLRNGVEIPGTLNATSYTQVAADVGAVLTVAERVANGKGYIAVRGPATPVVPATGTLAIPAVPIVNAPADGTTAPVLAALTLSNGTAVVGTPFVATISGLTPDSARSLSGAGAAGLSISGSTVSGTPTATGTVNIIETLAGATGSPRTSANVITVASVITSPTYTPPAPALSATTSGTTVTLAWTDPAYPGGPSITGHKLYRGTVSGTLTLIGTITTASPYQDLSRVAGQTYYYALTAVDSAGTEGPQSSQVSITVASGTTVPVSPSTPVYRPSGTRVGIASLATYNKNTPAVAAGQESTAADNNFVVWQNREAHDIVRPGRYLRVTMSNMAAGPPSDSTSIINGYGNITVRMGLEVRGGTTTASRAYPVDVGNGQTGDPSAIDVTILPGTDGVFYIDTMPSLAAGKTQLEAGDRIYLRKRVTTADIWPFVPLGPFTNGDSNEYAEGGFVALADRTVAAPSAWPTTAQTTMNFFSKSPFPVCSIDVLTTLPEGVVPVEVGNSIAAIGDNASITYTNTIGAYRGGPQLIMSNLYPTINVGRNGNALLYLLRTEAYGVRQLLHHLYEPIRRGGNTILLDLMAADHRNGNGTDTSATIIANIKLFVQKAKDYAATLGRTVRVIPSTITPTDKLTAADVACLTTVNAFIRSDSFGDGYNDYNSAVANLTDESLWFTDATASPPIVVPSDKVHPTHYHHLRIFNQLKDSMRALLGDGNPQFTVAPVTTYTAPTANRTSIPSRNMVAPVAGQNSFQSLMQHTLTSPARYLKVTYQNILSEGTSLLTTTAAGVPDLTLRMGVRIRSSGQNPPVTADVVVPSMIENVSLGPVATPTRDAFMTAGQYGTLYVDLGQTYDAGISLLLQTRGTYASTPKWWPQSDIIGAAFNERSNFGTDLPDNTVQTTAWGSVNNDSSYGTMVPRVIETMGLPYRPASFILAGDSISSAGSGDSASSTVGSGFVGWAQRALGKQVAWTNVGVTGEPLIATLSSATQKQIRITDMLAKGFTHFICAWGPNDIASQRTVSQHLSSMDTLAAQCEAAGVRFIPVTILPRPIGTVGGVPGNVSQSINGLDTGYKAGATEQNGTKPGIEAWQAVNLINAAIRTDKAGAPAGSGRYGYGFLDPHASVADPNDPTIFRTDTGFVFSGDGIHPPGAYHQKAGADAGAKIAAIDAAYAPAAVGTPVVSGVGKPANTLTADVTNGYTVNPQWVSGEPFGDPTTFTTVVGSGTSYTLSAVGADNGKRIAYRAANAQGTVATSTGVVCTDLLLGSYFGFHQWDKAIAFAKALGRDMPDFCHEQLGWDTIDQTLQQSGDLGGWKTACPNAKMMINIPLGFSSMPSTAPEAGGVAREYTYPELQAGLMLKHIADGLHDTKLTQMFTNIKNLWPDATLRIAHEYNGGWNKWFATTASTSLWKQAWIKYVTLARAVSGSDFRFDKTATMFSGGAGYGQTWPGDEYVDVVSYDAYQQGFPPSALYATLGRAAEYHDILRDDVKQYQSCVIGYGGAVPYSDTRREECTAFQYAFAAAQGATPFSTRSANGAEKDIGHPEWGTGWRVITGELSGTSGDNDHYTRQTLIAQQANRMGKRSKGGGFSGWWGTYQGDYKHRAILSSIIPAADRNSFGITNQKTFVDGQLPADLKDEMPKQARAYWKWWATEAKQNALLPDPTPIAAPVVSVANITVAENDTTVVTSGGAQIQAKARFTFLLDHPVNRQVEFKVATVGITATSGDDFTPYVGQTLDTMFYIAAGASSATLDITVKTDTITEGAEAFKIVLSEPYHCTFANTEATCTIAGEGTETVVSVPATATVTEGGTATVRISLGAASTNSITVNYATVDAVAVAGLDYTAVSGSVTFAPGDTFKDVTVTTLADQLTEGTESFNFVISNPVSVGNVTLANTTCGVSITDVAPVSAGNSYLTGMTGLFDATLNAAFQATTGLMPTWRNEKASADSFSLPLDSGGAAVSGNQPVRTLALTGTSKPALVFMSNVADRSSSGTVDMMTASKDGAISTLFDAADPSIFMLCAFKPYEKGVSTFIGGASRAIDTSTTATTGGTQRIGFNRTTSGLVNFVMRWDGRTTAGVATLSTGVTVADNQAAVFAVLHKNGVTSVWASVAGAAPTQVIANAAQAVPGGSQAFADLMPCVGSYYIMSGGIPVANNGAAYSGEIRMMGYGSGDLTYDPIQIINDVNAYLGAT